MSILSKPARRGARRLTLAGLAAAAVPLGGLAHPATASATTATADNPLAAYAVSVALQSERAWFHLPALRLNQALCDQAMQHSVAMAQTNALYDTAHLSTIGVAVPNWTSLAQNSGVGATPALVAYAFAHSAAHLANILGPYNQYGVAVVSSGGNLWVTEDFAAAP